MPKTLEQQIILAAITKKPREFLIAHPEYKLSAAEEKKFKLAQHQLAKGLPLAYILGHQWFFGRKFLVNKNVLIPRPETEQLVERALEFCRTARPHIIIDVGTGSGAIIASIAANAKLANSNFFGLDISAKALQVAKKNSKSLGRKNSAKLSSKPPIKFLSGSLLNPLAKMLAKNSAAQQPILITANLPYLSKKELLEPSIKHEPKLALYGGQPDHSLIEKLLKQISKLPLRDFLLLLEFNYNQGTRIKKLAKKYLPASTCQILQDLRGFDRIAAIRVRR